MVVTGGSGKFKLRSVVKRYPWPQVKPYNLSEVRTYRFESGTVRVVKKYNTERELQAEESNKLIILE